jgi:hypothetical protein
MAKAVILSWLLLVGGMSLWSSGISQQRCRDVPLHARIAVGEQGWVCHPGFRQLARICAYVQDGLTDKITAGAGYLDQRKVGLFRSLPRYVAKHCGNDCWIP